jgi:hypothetical protein
LCLIFPIIYHQFHNYYMNKTATHVTAMVNQVSALAAKACLLLLLSFFLQSSEGFAQTVNYFTSGENFCAGSDIVANVKVSSTNSTTRYNWQYKDKSNTWVCFVNGKNLINGVVYNVSSASNQGQLTNVSLIINSCQTSLDAVSIRLIMYNGANPCSVSASSCGGTEKVQDLNILTGKDCSNCNALNSHTTCRNNCTHNCSHPNCAHNSCKNDCDHTACGHPNCGGKLTLGNQVWNDRDGDGKHDPNEPGIGGATISLYTDNNEDNLPDGAAIRTTQTDVQGHYLFTNLKPGRYIASIPILPGYQQSPNNTTGGIVGAPQPGCCSLTPDSDKDDDNNLVRLVGSNGPGGIVYTNAITLTAGGEPTDDGDDANGNLTFDLAECGNSGIGDFVWNDLNGNGIQDAGEPGINGVTVTITFEDGRTATAVTHNYNATNNANAPQYDGYYDFINLGPSTYKISFETPSGFTSSPANQGGNDAKDSDPVNGGAVTVTLAPNQSNFTIDAGFTKATAPPPGGCPNAVKFEGFENGSFTSGGGSDLYNGLPRNGSYQVVQNVGELGGGGYLDIHPRNGSYFLASHTSNDEGDRIWYTKINVVPGQTYNFCFYATLLKNLGSGANYILGIYANGQQLGTGRVNFGWSQICGSYKVPAGVTTLELSIRDPKKGLFFVAIDDICISGPPTGKLRLGNQVWNDRDGDGKRDPNEPGIGGATISLYTDNNSDNLPDGPAIATTQTDVQGHYLFTNLAPGRYIASMAILPGYQQSPNITTGGIVGAPQPGCCSLTPDEDKDNDNNLVRLEGPNGPGGIVYTNAITLTEGGEPTDDGDDANGNLTFDLAQCGNSGIGDFVWNDTNGNGIQDAGEHGINGATVTLTFEDGTTATVATHNYSAANNANEPELDGYYDFINLGPGAYKVTFATPTGLNPSPSNQGDDTKDSDPVNGSVTLTLAANQSNFTTDAGFTDKAVPPPPPTGNDCYYTKGSSGYYGGFEAGSDNFASANARTEYSYGMPKDGAYEIVQKAGDAGGGGYLSLKAQEGDWFMLSHTRTSSNNKIWYKTFTVTAGETYNFCAWIANAKQDPVNGFRIDLQVNGVSIANKVATYDWLQLCGTYTVPDGVTSATFVIVDLDAHTGPSHFLGLDGICISKAQATAPITAAATSQDDAQGITTAANNFEEEAKPSSCNLKVALEPRNPLCYNMRTGSIIATVTGSVGKVSYSWSNGSTGTNLNNIGAGTYTLKIKDQATGCEVTSGEVTLTNPAQLVATVKSPETDGYNIILKDSKTGSIDVTVKGGTYPYEYEWNNGSTSQDLSGLDAGKYVVTVKDAAKCTVQADIILKEPSSKLEVVPVINQVTCTAKGSAEVNVTGGIAPYTYKWSNGASGKKISELTPGKYTVTVKDAIGGEVTESFEMRAYDLAVNVTANRTSVGKGETVTLYAEATGGAKAYSYKWSESADLKAMEKGSATVNPATNTTYSVAVKDASGCTATSSITVKVVEAAQASQAATERVAVEIAQQGMAVTPNPSNGNFNVLLNSFTGKTEIRILDASGKEVDNKSVNASGAQSIVPFNLTRLPKGMYIVNVISGDKSFQEKIVIR